MSCLEFVAPEYQPDTHFLTNSYAFVGDEQKGWDIKRNGQTCLQLGPGYVPIKTQFCGVCATDLMRHHLPFPLPQITGHEVIGSYQDKTVAIEINASHLARGIAHRDCPYCSNGLHIHCPERLTLGIDRLPGGFAPWLLAPRNALHVLPQTMSPRMAVLLEPFAAALKAVRLSPPLDGDRVAVIGPRRLGMLLLAALAAYRQTSGRRFTLTAVVRHGQLEGLARSLGADDVLFVDKGHAQADTQFDVVFDTTGSQSGFQLAIELSRRVLHLKSTHGQEMQGLRHLTDMVINEQSLQVYNEANLSSSLQAMGVAGRRINIYLAPSVPQDLCQKLQRMDGHIAIHQVPPAEALQSCVENSAIFANALVPRYDLAIVASLDEVDTMLRGQGEGPASLLKPQGRIFVLAAQGKASDSALYHAVTRSGIRVETSRCGDFADALGLLSALPELSGKLEDLLITQEFALAEIEQAFQYARESKKSIKVIINTSQD